MLQAKINEALLKEQESRKDRKRSGKFSPSSFGKCYRAQIWNRKAEPVTNKPDERALRIFKVGNIFHDFVQQYIEVENKEVRIESDDCLGYADIVTSDSVIDIKSQHSRGFWYMKKESYDIAKERFPNWLQVAWYAMQLKKKYCKLFIISKDDLTIAEYSMPTEKWIDKVNAELGMLLTFWLGDNLPPAEARCYNGKECNYCGFKEKCNGKD